MSFWTDCLKSALLSGLSCRGKYCFTFAKLFQKQYQGFFTMFCTLPGFFTMFYTLPGLFMMFYTLPGFLMMFCTWPGFFMMFYTLPGFFMMLCTWPGFFVMFCAWLGFLGPRGPLVLSLVNPYLRNENLDPMYTGIYAS